MIPQFHIIVTIIKIIIIVVFVTVISSIISIIIFNITIVITILVETNFGEQVHKLRPWHATRENTIAGELWSF